MSIGAPGRHVFAGLDLIRGLLCLLVVIWHGDQFLALHAAPRSLPLAVDAFFILSGFVVAYAYLQKLEAGMSAQTLILVRLIRFYPLLLLGLTLGALRLFGQVSFGHNAGAAPISWAHQLPQFLFLPVAPSDADVLFPLDPPAWSLFAEVLINIAFAFLWPRLSIRVLSIVTALGAACVFVALLAYGGRETGWGWSTAPGLLARVTFGFPAGVLLYRLYQRGLRAPAFSGWLLLAAVACVFAVRVPTAWLPYWHALLVLVLCPLMVWFGARARLAGWGAAAAAFTGRISFAVYALHYPILGLVLGADAKTVGLAPRYPELAIPILIVVCVLAAWSADVLWDRPVTRMLRETLLSRARPARAA